MSPRDPAGSGEPGDCRPYRREWSHLREGPYGLERYKLLRELAVQFMTEGSARAKSTSAPSSPAIRASQPPR
jgi:hypothetical protein